jgi:hypothetical protein
MFNKTERLTQSNQLILFRYLKDNGVPFKLTGNLACAWYGYHQHRPQIDILVPRSIGIYKMVYTFCEENGLEMIVSLNLFYRKLKKSDGIQVGIGMFNVNFIFQHNGHGFYDYRAVELNVGDVFIYILERKELLRYLKNDVGMKEARAYLALSGRRSESDLYYLQRYF